MKDVENLNLNSRESIDVKFEWDKVKKQLEKDLFEVINIIFGQLG